MTNRLGAFSQSGKAEIRKGTMGRRRKEKGRLQRKIKSCLKFCSTLLKSKLRTQERRQEGEREALNLYNHINMPSKDGGN